MKSSWKRPFHLHRWEWHILFWRSLWAPHASRNRDPAVGCLSDSCDQVSQGQQEEWSHEDGRVGSPSTVQRRITFCACKCTRSDKAFFSTVNAGDLSVQRSSKGKNHWRVWQSVLAGHAELKAEPRFLAGVFLEMVSTHFKKREKLLCWHNGRQKRKIWFYATADVS